MSPPDEAALLLAACVARGDIEAAAAMWEACTPRAKRDAMFAAIGFLIMAWGDSPGALAHIEWIITAGQN
jgi:hypothetical protein